MKSVLISIKPKWCELIASGNKTIEVRKTKPKLQTPFKVYIYMTKTYDTLFGYGNPKKLCVDGGKVIGEFVCDKIIDIDLGIEEGVCFDGELQEGFETNGIGNNPTCLSFVDLENYLTKNKGYGWHISNLVIYDKSRELYEFYRKCEKTPCESCEHLKYQAVNSAEYDYDCEFLGNRIPITRPPQSWCYVEGE